MTEEHEQDFKDYLKTEEAMRVVERKLKIENQKKARQQKYYLNRKKILKKYKAWAAKTENKKNRKLYRKEWYQQNKERINHKVTVNSILKYFMDNFIADLDKLIQGHKESSYIGIHFDISLSEDYNSKQGKRAVKFLQKHKIIPCAVGQDSKVITVGCEFEELLEFREWLKINL